MSEQQELKDCPFCGEQINAKAVKCRHCGSMLNGGAPSAPQPTPAAVPIPAPVSAPVPPAEKKPGCFKTTLYGIIGVICLIGGCNMLFGGGGDVVPLNEYTMEKYKEAHQDALWQVAGKGEESGHVVESLAFRRAVEKMGYDPDKTVLRWLSPEFQKEIENAGMEKGMTMGIGRMMFLQVALGDGSNKKEFERVISHWSPEVQEAAKKRRSEK